MRAVRVLAVAGAMLTATPVGSVAKDPPPVVQELGEVMPTPVPSPERAEKIRLITSFAVQNQPDGDSVISFQASDFSRTEEDQYRTIAVESYSLVLEKKDLRELRARILYKIRDLEEDLLDYVEIAGPPREREPITWGGGSAP